MSTLQLNSFSKFTQLIDNIHFTPGFVTCVGGVSKQYQEGLLLEMLIRHVVDNPRPVDAPLEHLLVVTTQRESFITSFLLNQITKITKNKQLTDISDRDEVSLVLGWFAGRGYYLEILNPELSDEPIDTVDGYLSMITKAVTLNVGVLVVGNMTKTVKPVDNYEARSLVRGLREVATSNETAVIFDYPYEEEVDYFITDGTVEEVLLKVSGKGHHLNAPHLAQEVDLEIDTYDNWISKERSELLVTVGKCRSVQRSPLSGVVCSIPFSDGGIGLL